jgi:single-strand DNA-binding protein
MNDLNSVLIEGTLIKDAEIINENGLTVCKFTLSSNHYIKKDKNIDKIITFVNVEAWSNLSENCYKKARKGIGVRVVGHLKQDNNLIVVEAEHIEFRYEPKKKKNQNEFSFDEGNEDGKNK